jgi:hypothetical protein
VNTASAITRGFINVTKSGIRAAKPEVEANDKRMAVVFMVDSSTRISVVKGRAASRLLQGGVRKRE